MGTATRPGFSKQVLETRYNVSIFKEDAWHSYAAERTNELIHAELKNRGAFNLLLNAGSGVYAINPLNGHEIRVDLFQRPLGACQSAVCANVQALPFRSGVFDIVLCVGEVLGYCDPAAAIAELARVAASKALIICDFESSRGVRHWLKDQFGRAADLATSEYNGTPERTWIYDPAYISSLMSRYGLVIHRRTGTHIWSALGRRFGLRAGEGLLLQRLFRSFPLPASWGELTTLVAEKP